MTLRFAIFPAKVYYFFNKISDKSNLEAVHKVSSIGMKHPLTESELRRASESRLNEFLGNLPPVAVLPKFPRNDTNSENTEWCYLGTVNSLGNLSTKIG